jgi:FKBP-type peptidyl-prolyl cis-trans isomerase FkpA
MKKITTYVFIAVALMTAASCANEGFKRTKSGLQYKIIPDGSKGDLVKRGQILKISFIQKVHDSILNRSPEGFPTYQRVDSVGPTYNPAEVFGLLHKGDSVVIVLQVDTILRKSKGNLPPFLKKKDKILLSIKVLDIFASDSLVKVDRDKYLDAEKAKEVAAIDDYLNKNNITHTEKTKDGVYYQILTAGDGPRADSGKMVSIKYTGYTMDGKFFDSNTDSTKQVQRHPLTLFEFRAGVSGAIPGMVEAITAFRKGDKGKMYVPSILGYGAQGAGAGVIKPFANLIFDIEVVDVKDAPARPAMPGMPPGMPQRAVKPTK